MKRIIIVILVVGAAWWFFADSKNEPVQPATTKPVQDLSDEEDAETIEAPLRGTASALPTPANHAPQETPFNPREWGDNSELDQLRATAPITPTPILTPASTFIIGTIPPVPAETISADKQSAGAHLEALKELASSTRRLAGVRGGSGAGQIDSAADALASDDEDQDDIIKKYPRVVGQARGYQMLYLMHPNARATVERQVQAMLDSNVTEPYLGVLTDGTFGKDYAYLNGIVKRLSVEGRALTLALYLSNGSTQRTYKELPIVAGFNSIDPLQFRDKIQRDLHLRDQFSAMAKEARPTFELNRSLNPNAKNIAIVMLEDNLDSASYASMRALALKELSGIAQIVRNPCPGCTDGSDGNSLGDPVELHDPLQLTTLRANDGFALDGIGYGFGSDLGGNVLSLDQVKQLLTLAKARGLNYFGLWRAERQGRGAVGKVHPDQRVYEVPTPEQVNAEIELLRYGLASVQE